MADPERIAALLALAKELGVHVLDSQDEYGNAEFAPANAVVTLDHAWVRDGSVSRRERGVLVLGCRRRGP